MALPKLRVYHGPGKNGPGEHIPGKDVQAFADEISSDSQKTVNVKFSEVLPILADAIENHREWLKDFADDEMTISSDLFDVLLTYQRYHRPTG